MPPRLLLTHPLPANVEALVGDAAELVVLDVPKADRADAIRTAAPEADALITLLSDRVDRALLESCDHLRVVANYAVGFDNVDLVCAHERGVWVTTTPDVLTDATADLAFALLLGVARRMRQGERLLRQGRFEGWAPAFLLGKELSGGVLGVVGFGRIGQAMARRARGFGMDVVYTSRSEVSGAHGAKRVELGELLERADVVSLHCPLTPQTHHLIGADELSRMRPDAILINTARGPVVDEAALVRALERGQLWGAGLDVFEQEPRVHPGLIARDDVLLLPHLGSATETARRRMAEVAVHNALEALAGRRPPNALQTDLDGRPS